MHEWYGTGGGGGYSEGAASNCYGQSGGGRSSVEVGVDGLHELAEREAINYESGFARLTTPSGNEIIYSSHGEIGINLPDKKLVESCGVCLEKNGVQVIQIAYYIYHMYI